jgi:hypothetical protein
VRRSWAASKPVSSLDRPRRTGPPKRRIRYLRPVELDALLRSVPDDAVGSVEGSLYLTAAMIGLRQGDRSRCAGATSTGWPAGAVAGSYMRGTLGLPKSGEGRSVLLPIA